MNFHLTLFDPARIQLSRDRETGVGIIQAKNFSHVGKACQLTNSFATAASNIEDRICRLHQYMGEAPVRQLRMPRIHVAHNQSSKPPGWFFALSDASCLTSHNFSSAEPWNQKSI